MPTVAPGRTGRPPDAWCRRGRHLIELSGIEIAGERICWPCRNDRNREWRSECRRGPQKPTATQLKPFPVTWVPTLVRERLVQLDGLCRKAPFPWKESPDVQLYAEHCGLVPLPGWKLARGYSLIHLPMTKCPWCGAYTRRLIANAAGQWNCQHCWLGSWTRTELLLSEYVCGLRIGLVGKTMLRRRGVILRRLSRLADGAKTADHLALLSLAGPVLRWKPTWNRRGARDVGLSVSGLAPGPIHRVLAKHMMAAMCDALLHRDAFVARFAPPPPRRIMAPQSNAALTPP